MSTSAPPPQDSRPAGEQRWLEAALRVGGVLVVLGLLTTVVIVGAYLAGAATPGTWAYVVAMLAPLGFGLILLALILVAVRRRRRSIGTGAGAAAPRPTAPTDEDESRRSAGAP